MLRAVVLALLSGCAAFADVVDPPAPVSPMSVMVAHTVLLKDPGCTGVRIGGGLVVTAKHCLADDAVKGGTYSDLTIGYISPDHDFAVLDGDKPIEAVGVVPAVVGERIYVVGYPGSIDDGKQYLTVTDGVYTGVEYEDMQRITAYAYYGNSGGGAWNAEGELVGILVEIRPIDSSYGEMFPVPMPAHSYIVPARLLRDILFE